MFAFRVISLFFHIICVVNVSVADEKTDILFEEFDARPLSVEEKRVLQSALAFNGYYSGYLDGKWGAYSQESIERYSIDKFDDEPLNIIMALLVVEFLDNLEKYQWEYVRSPSLGISFALPLNGQQPPLTRNGEVAFVHHNSSLRFEAFWHETSILTQMHNRLLSARSRRSEPYAVRRPDKWVSSIESLNGEVTHLSSQRRGAHWVSTLVTASQTDKHLLNTVVASITQERNPDWHLPEHGHLNRILQLTALLFENKRRSGDDTDTPRSSSGTGFYINAQAQVLTNYHVIENCTHILVNEDEMEVLWDWEDTDLAILSPKKSKLISTFARFSDNPAKLNSDVTVVGFPLQGILDGAIVTRGSISGLKGIGGDINAMQISAEIQPGNSGGPVLNSSGAIVGIVFGKLDSQRLADATGDIPQNVNFAVKAELAKLFLISNSVDFTLDTDGEILSPTELADAALRFTVPIKCH